MTCITARCEWVSRFHDFDASAFLIIIALPQDQSGAGGFPGCTVRTLLFGITETAFLFIATGGFQISAISNRADRDSRVQALVRVTWQRFPLASRQMSPISMSVTKEMCDGR
jgi:hypothetical protein